MNSQTAVTDAATAATSAATDLCFLPLAEAAGLIASRKLSPVELVSAHLAHIAARDPALSSFITVTAEQAMDEARAAETAIMKGEHRGPLHGIPYSLKDNYYTRGIRTTAASRLMLDFVPEEDATLHARLRDAGAILVGKNNTFEYGTGTGESQPDLPFPLARSPWSTARFTAGSSSGTGVAVGAGFAMLGLGSDTGGSVRAPSAANGLFGLKPTYGRLSRAGILPNSFSFDAGGPLTRTVRDAAIAMGFLAGHDPRDPTSAAVAVPDYLRDLDRGVKGLRIGYIRRFHERDVEGDADVIAAIEATVDLLRRLGAEIVDIDVPYSVQDYRLLVRMIGQSEALALHQETFRRRHHLMGPALRDKCLGSITVSAADFIKATRWRRQMMAATDDAIAACDAVICASGMKRLPFCNDEPARVGYMLGSANCCFNVSGHPAASLPIGFDGNGMPMSLQVVGRHFDEAMVLRVASAYEAETNWYRRRPQFLEETPPPAVEAPRPARTDAPDAPGREEVAAILRRMRVENLDDTIIDRATALAAGAAAQAARLPAELDLGVESAHVLAVSPPAA